MNMSALSESPTSIELAPRGRYLILAAAFLGWMFSGVQMSLMNLASRSATMEFARHGVFDEDAALSWERLLPDGQRKQTSSLSQPEVDKLVKTEASRWFGRFNAAFLLGAACGGLVFGWVGDRYGRVKAMGLTIVWYSLFTGVSWFVVTPEQ